MKHNFFGFRIKDEIMTEKCHRKFLRMIIRQVNFKNVKGVLLNTPEKVFESFSHHGKETNLLLDILKIIRELKRREMIRNDQVVLLVQKLAKDYKLPGWLVNSDSDNFNENLKRYSDELDKRYSDELDNSGTHFKY